MKFWQSSITVGAFTFSRDDNGKILWITKTDGEAMECSDETESALESILEQFWEENF